MWLSIIIPLYNCAPYIGTCLDSILQQGLAADEYEVVVIDDGSTDGGGDLVERDYCQRHPQIRLVRQSNGGAAAARNRGISEARGEYIEFVDADDRLLPGGIATLRDAYLSDGRRPDMVSMGMYTVDRYYDPARFEHINDPARSLMARSSTSGVSSRSDGAACRASSSGRRFSTVAYVSKDMPFPRMCCL